MLLPFAFLRLQLLSGGAYCSFFCAFYFLLVVQPRFPHISWMFFNLYSTFYTSVLLSSRFNYVRCNRTRMSAWYLLQSQCIMYPPAVELEFGLNSNEFCAHVAMKRECTGSLTSFCFFIRLMNSVMCGNSCNTKK